MNVKDIELRGLVVFKDDPQVYRVTSVGLYFDDMVTCERIEEPGKAWYTFLAEDLSPVSNLETSGSPVTRA